MRCSAPPPLIGEILSIGANVITPIPQIDSKFDVFAKEIKIPVFKNDEIEDITLSLARGVPLNQVLSSERFNFPFDNDFLDSFPQHPLHSQQLNDIVGIFALNSFLAWFCKYEQTGDASSSSIIMRNLKYTFTTSYKSIGCSCFVLASSVLIASNDPHAMWSSLYCVIEFLNSFPQQKLALCFAGRLLALENEFIPCEYDNYMHSLMDIQLRKGNAFFNEKAANEFAEIVSANKLAFRYSTYNFIASIYDLLTEESVYILLKDVGSHFNEILASAKPLNIAKPKRKVVNLEVKYTNELLMGFSDRKTFVKGLSEEEVPTLEVTTDLLSFFDVNVQPLVNSIILIANKTKENQVLIANSFIFLLDPAEGKDKYFKLYTVFLSFITQFVSDLSDTNVPPAIIHPMVFDGEVTVFSYQGDFATLGSIRDVAIEYLCDSGHQTVYLLLLLCIDSPLLLAEVFSRLSKKTALVSSFLVPKSNFVKTLSQIVLSYKVANISEKDPQAIEEIECARTAFLLFIKHLINEKSVFSNLFFDNVFVQTIFSLLYEENIQQYPLSLLSTLLNSYVSNEVVTALYNITLLTASSMPDERHATLMSNLLKTLNTGLTTNREASRKFSVLCPIVLKAMLAEGAPIYLFENASTFLALMSPYFIFDNSMMIYKDSSLAGASYEFLRTLYVKLVQLLAGDIVNAIVPTFIVKQPVAIKIMFSVFYNTPIMRDAAEFADKLCKFSPKNIAAFEKIDICAFIISLLEADKKSNKMDSETVSLMLSVFSTISMISSNVQNVIKFISLLKPFDDIHISYNQQLYFNTLNYIVAQSLIEPKSYQQINRSMTFYPMEADFKDNLIFTFTCWFNIVTAPPEYQQVLFNITFDDTDQIGVFVSENSLFFSQINYDLITQGKLKNKVDCNKWHFLGFTYEMEETCCKVYTIFDGKFKQIKIEKFDFVSKFKNPVLQIGCKNPEDVGEQSKITNCGVFDILQISEQNSMLEAGIKETKRLPKEPIIFVSEFEKATRKPGFVDILIERFGVTSLLPLFSTNNLRFPDEKPFEMQFRSAFLLLKNILLCSREAQISFYNSRGFYIFEHLISKFWVESITLKVYHQLIELFGTLEIEILQQQLFDAILTNVPFLMKLPAHIHMKILNVWSNSLFLNYYSEVRSLRPVSYLLNLLRTFYYIEPIEGEPNDTSIERPKDLDIIQCRNNILIILIQYINDKITETDFIVISDFLVSCKDSNLIDEVSSILIRNIISNKKCFTFSLESPYFIKLIRSMIERGENKTVQYAFSLFVAALSENILSEEFLKVSLWSILLNFPKTAINKETLDFSLVLLHSQPRILPFCCFLAKESKEFDFISKIKKSNFGKIEIFFMVWIFILFDDLDAKQRIDAIDFVLNHSNGTLYEIILGINSAFGCFPDFCSRIKDSVIMEYSNLNNKTEDQIEDFLHTCCVEIFFSKERSALETGNEKIFSTEEFLKNCFSAPSKSYGLKFNEKGIWQNSHIAVLSLKMFEKSKTRKFLALDLALSAFLQRTDFLDVDMHLKRVNITEKELSQYSDFISLLKYHSFISNRHPEFSCVRVTDDSYKCIERVLRSFCEEEYEADNFDDICRKANGFVEEMRQISFTLNVNNLIQRKEEISESGAKLWHKLWNSLSSERAPWYTEDRDKEDVFEVDETPCFSFSPTKTKRKKKIAKESFDDDDEIKASFTVEIHPSEEKKTLEIRTKSINLDKNVMKFNEITQIFVSSNKIQIFSCTGLHFCFELGQSIEEFVTEIRKEGNFDIYSTVNGFTEDWHNYEISTFEYISILNIMQGKSYSDPNNLPVFPKPPEFAENCSVDLYVKGNLNEQYKNRMELENSENISDWISKFLFVEHPKRNPKKITKTVEEHFKFEMDAAVCAVIDNSNSEYPMIFTLSKGGQINCVQIYLSILKFVRGEQKITRFSSFEKVIGSSMKFVLYSKDSPDIVQVDAFTAKSLVIETEYTKINFISVDNNLTAVCGNDNIISVFNYDEQILELQLYSDSPSCIAISETFHSVVCCTSEGAILIYSLTDGLLSHVAEIGKCQIRSVCVTKCFGIICCYLVKSGMRPKYSLLLLTINGEKISETDIGGSSTVSTFSSNNGTDYLVFFHENGRIAVMNVGNQKLEVISSTNYGSRILSYTYSSHNSSIEIITSDGMFHLLPVSI